MHARHPRTVSALEGRSANIRYALRVPYVSYCLWGWAENVLVEHQIFTTS